jgi:hypothetical protein
MGSDNKVNPCAEGNPACAPFRQGMRDWVYAMKERSDYPSQWIMDEYHIDEHILDDHLAKVAHRVIREFIESATKGKESPEVDLTPLALLVLMGIYLERTKPERDAQAAKGAHELEAMVGLGEQPKPVRSHQGNDWDNVGT